MEYPRWNDPALAVNSDSRRTAKYRLLQSRWRETVLGEAPGVSSSGQPVGSMLSENARLGAQWLTPHIGDYVERRLPDARAEHAAVEEQRLQRNLLSSQPMCFNIFGHLAAYPDASARVLSKVLNREILSVNDVLVEHTPVASRELGDRSAFDAFVTITTPAGLEFVGVETKYTEPFSQKPYERDSYLTASEDLDGWLLPGSYQALVAPATNQLWRTVLLAQLTSMAPDGFVDGSVVVLAAHDDTGATEAVAGVRSQLRNPDRLQSVVLDALVSAALDEPDLEMWAQLFNARYLTQ